MDKKDIEQIGQLFDEKLKKRNRNLETELNKVIDSLDIVAIEVNQINRKMEKLPTNYDLKAHVDKKVVALKGDTTAIIKSLEKRNKLLISFLDKNNVLNKKQIKTLDKIKVVS